MLSSLLLSAICGKLGVGFSEGLSILGIQAKDKSVVINFLFGQAKLATWLTRCNWLVDPELMFQQLRAEYEY